MPRTSVELAVLASLVLGVPGSAFAQNATPRALKAGFGIGATIPRGYAVDGIGVNAQLSGIWSSNARVALRADLRAQALLSGAVAEPSCIPAAACEGYALRPDQVYSATLSAEVRPFASTPRVFAIVGGGAYHGRGPHATNFGTTVGLSGGIGLDLSRSLVLEAQYHHLPNAFGTLTGLVTPAISYRF